MTESALEMRGVRKTYEVGGEEVDGGFAEALAAGSAAGAGEGSAAIGGFVGDSALGFGFFGRLRGFGLLGGAGRPVPSRIVVLP